MSLEVSVIVPDRVFWKNSVREIILPTLNGQMGILKDHIPVLTGLDTGLMLIKTELDKDWLVFVVLGGFALVNSNKVTILVNEAELASDIDIEEAKSSYDSAKLNLELNSGSDSKKKLESLVLFKKTRTRLQAAQQIKGLSLIV
uniref:ATP synthase epsilon chain, chloroplastic n=1 Tax=Phacus orbicularis TaxID=158829 RepID=A0A172F1Y5_9EUGL|nr:ATPase epsilon subunit [Phacus orbicularis]